MIKSLSLRVKITLIATIIMMIIAIVLTVLSVFNANLGFLTMMNEVVIDSTTDVQNGENQLEYELTLPEMTSINDIKSYLEEGVIEKDTDISQSLASTTLNAVHNFKIASIMYMMIIITIGTIIIYMVLGKVLKPVKRLRDEVAIINENKLSQRVDGFEVRDEIGELASSFNEMLDRLDKAFEAQKRFSSDAAHELKTPLTALKTNLDILAMDENPTKEDYKRIVSVFRKQTDRMINLVNNLFVLSAQKVYDFDDTVDLDKVINEIIMDISGDAEKKNISIDYKKCNTIIKGNYTMISHAIGNIMQNAVKYNNKFGNVTILVEKFKENCIIKVKDTGIGIPEDKIDNIFEAFYRVDKSRSRKVAGAGLGLAISKDIINKHNGKIKYYKNEKGGSVFEITLPINI